MNCLEFHREKLADPRRLSPEARAHAEACTGCTSFARDVDNAERALERALLVPVPDGLADRILLRARDAKRRPRQAWALAAGIVLMSALAFAYFRQATTPADEYARDAIEHVAMEPESLTTLRNADPAAFATAIQASGGSLREPLANVRYVRLCPVEGGYGWHIVFETSEGLATLILVPGKPLAAEQTASANGWSALVRPARNGYYAIVAPSASAMAHADRLLREQVNWGAS